MVTTSTWPTPSAMPVVSWEFDDGQIAAVAN